jgi:hypothetical protein
MKSKFKKTFLQGKKRQKETPSAKDLLNAKYVLGSKDWVSSAF